MHGDIGRLQIPRERGGVEQGAAGQVRGQDLKAYAFHLEGGYNWLKSSWKPRIGLQYNYSTGMTEIFACGVFTIWQTDYISADF